MNVSVRDHPEGCVVSVRAQPGARNNRIVGEHGGAIKVAVTAPPDRGRANAAIADVLAKALGCKTSQIELLAGPTSRNKTFLIRGTKPDQLRSRIKELLSKGPGC